MAGDEVGGTSIFLDIFSPRTMIEIKAFATIMPGQRGQYNRDRELAPAAFFGEW
jgi:hypothetical protein